MKREQRVVWYGAVAVVLALGAMTSAKTPGLVGHWALDEGQGTTALDSSGNGLNGTLRGGPTWAIGQLGGALDFNGTSAYVEVPHNPLLSLTGEITIAAWTYMRTTSSDEMAIVSKGSWAANNLPYELTETRGSQIFWQFYNDAGRDSCSPPSPAAGEWHHLTGTYDGKSMRCYIDGKLAREWAYAGAMPQNTMSLTIGRRSGGGTFFNGRIDDVQLWSRALSVAEINKIMLGLADASLAQDPNPQDQAVDVPRDTLLSWTAGQYPAVHDVYLGTVFADVNNASRTTSKGVLASQGQADTTFTPAGVLAYGQTYYWRVDEVNKSADGAISKGNVWSFTVEPYAYPITKITATASSAQPGAGPENTINGSGLTGDLHGTDGPAMWTTAGALPAWIQYQFDNVYKLYDLKVWNSNQVMEPYVGFGAKDVKIEYSADGATWTTLPNVPQFTRAPGLAGYAANTTVSFGGAMARYVKLTINTNWGGISPVTGLSEVRFSYVPVQARAPQPAGGATGVAVNATLTWRPGREAASHQVFFGTDPNAVAQGTAPSKTVTAHAFDPGTLNYGTTYYWKVDEVNTTIYPGTVWSFTTKEFAVVDDFESYDDDQNRIYDTWIDGASDGKSGSYVGYNPTAAQLAAGAHFAETTIVHGGRQSLPVEYNNVKTPCYSEATRTFATPQDWTGNGADTLQLWFRGRPVAFAETAAGITLSGAGADIYQGTSEFRYAYKKLTGDGAITVRLDSAQTMDPWTKCGLMIRDGLAPLAMQVHMISAPQQRLVEWMYRSTTGSAVTTQFNTAAGTNPLPVWLRLTRAGNVFTGECSADGKTWAKIASGATTSSTTIVMPGTAYIGLVVCSDAAGQVAVGNFSQVATTGNIADATWQTAMIGTTNQPANVPDLLYVVVEDKAGKRKMVVHPDPMAVTANAWTAWRIAGSDLTGVNLAAVKKLTIGIGNTASPKPGATGRLYLDDIGFGHPSK